MYGYIRACPHVSKMKYKEIQSQELYMYVSKKKKKS
jgi:hypothetical protein